MNDTIISDFWLIIWWVIAFFFFLFMMLGCAHDPWKPEDTALAVASTIAASADAYTTCRMLDGGNYERNPLMGRHPSDTRVIMGIAGAQVGTLIVAYFLPKAPRRLLLGGKTLVHIGLVQMNMKLEW